MAVRTGLEPATPCVTGRYSNQLNYRTNSDIGATATADRAAVFLNRGTKVGVWGITCKGLPKKNVTKADYCGLFVGNQVICQNKFYDLFWQITPFISP